MCCLLKKRCKGKPFYPFRKINCTKSVILCANRAFCAMVCAMESTLLVGTKQCSRWHKATLTKSKKVYFTQ